MAGIARHMVFALALRDKLYPLSQPFHGLGAVLVIAERGKTHVSFTAWAEADTWSADYVGVV